MRKPWIAGILLAFALVFVATAPAFATEVGGFKIPDQSPTGPDRYVADFAHILKPEEKTQLIVLAQSINKSTSCEVVFMTVELEDPSMINQVSAMLGSKWGVGKRSQHNGIVIAEAARPGDWNSTSSSRKRKIWISPGYGISPILSNSELNQISTDKMQPLTKQNQWFAAFMAGGNELEKRLQAANVPQTSAANNPAPVSNSSSDLGFLPVLIVLVLILGGVVTIVVVRAKKLEAEEQARRDREAEAEIKRQEQEALRERETDEERRSRRATTSLPHHVRRSPVPPVVPVPVHKPDNDAERRREDEAAAARRRRALEEEAAAERRRREREEEEDRTGDIITGMAIGSAIGSRDDDSSSSSSSSWEPDPSPSFDTGIDTSDTGGFGGGDFDGGGGGCDA